MDRFARAIALVALIGAGGCATAAGTPGSAPASTTVFAPASTPAERKPHSKYEFWVVNESGRTLGVRLKGQDCMYASLDDTNIGPGEKHGWVVDTKGSGGCFFTSSWMIVRLEYDNPGRNTYWVDAEYSHLDTGGMPGWLVKQISADSGDIYKADVVTPVTTRCKWEGPGPYHKRIECRVESGRPAFWGETVGPAATLNKQADAAISR